MDSTTREVAFELLPVIRIYKDGTIERPAASPYVPPSPRDPQTGVSSKDITIPISPILYISARLYLPNLPQEEYHQPQKKLPILVYFPGGGFCIDTALCLHVHRFLNRLVSEAKVVAISVAYRVAPEYRLPAAYQDCWAALQWVASHSSKKQPDSPKEQWLVNHGDFDRLYIGGDSAGGNISHNMAMKTGAEGLCGGDVKILGAYVSHPAFGGSKPIGSEAKDKDFQKTCDKFWKFVYPSAPGVIDNSSVNPAGECAPSLTGLGCSKLLVCVAGKDELRDRHVWYYNLVKESGWNGELELFEEEGVEHCYHLVYDPENEEVKNMTKRLASFLV